jgi:hypothetical protein
MNYTYIIKNDFGLVRVERLVDPVKWCLEVSKSSGVHAEVVYMMPGIHLAEATRAALHEYSTVGEWINCTPDQAIVEMLHVDSSYKRTGVFQGGDESMCHVTLYEMRGRTTKGPPLSSLKLAQKKALLDLIKCAGDRRHLARMLGKPVSTINSWVDRGRISKGGAQLVTKNLRLSEKFPISKMRPDL